MPATDRPHLGLVCITFSEECRYRTITRKRLLTLPLRERRIVLRELYEDNLARLMATLAFCAAREIRLYRVTSDLFPFSDIPTGGRVLEAMAPRLAKVGRFAKRFKIRIVSH